MHFHLNNPNGLEHRFPFKVNPLHAVHTEANMSASVSVTLLQPKRKNGTQLKFSSRHLNVEVGGNIVFENLQDLISSKLGNIMSVGSSVGSF